MNDGQRRTLMVIHIPKAAGTTFRHIMERQYHHSQVFKIQNDIPAERERLEGVADVLKRELRVVFGHMCWGWHEALVPAQPHSYLTILRDPVDRVLSLYAYCRLPGHYLRDLVREMSVHDYVTTGVTCTADNGMTRQLCGADQFLREPYNDMAIPFGKLTTGHLNAAMKHLDQCAVVGVAERFDRVLERCQQQFGWRIGAYENSNVTTWPKPNREHLDRRTLDAIYNHNELDRQLYEYAKGLGA